MRTQKKAQGGLRTPKRSAKIQYPFAERFGVRKPPCAFFCVLFLFIAHTLPCMGLEPSDLKLQTLYKSIDPTSIAQHLAFYELYSDRPLGRQALNDAWQCLVNHDLEEKFPNNGLFPLSPSIIKVIVSLVNKPMNQEIILLPEESKGMMNLLSRQLHHYHLKGHSVWSEEELLKLPLDEIDLARGLFITQFGEDRSKIQSYEALLDLMALQIQARLPRNPMPETVIATINAFIFDEMGFRFPPHSLYAKEIDLYTFLPSVLDSRRGVCLGVSVLYMCIAQRLSLPLEMITPPGHIYVRYRTETTNINIETTARGIHVDSEEYLGINTRSLQERTMREVIGLVHFNQASVYWQNGDYPLALKAYQKAAPYMKDDPLLKELMGYILVLTGNREEGEKLIREIEESVSEHTISNNTMAQDYIDGHIDAKGIGVLLSKMDEDRASILLKKQSLEETLVRFPRFRAGIQNLAAIWLQLHRPGEALEMLNKLQSIDDTDPEMHYYLSILYAQRRDFPLAWSHFQRADDIVKKHQHNPKELKELRRELIKYCPE